MISPIFTALLIYLILSFFGWVSYSYLHPRALINKKLFILQLIYCIGVMAMGPLLVARYLGINNLIFEISLVAMGIAVSLHHLSIIYKKEKMHHKISHLLLFVPWAVAGFSGGYSFWPYIKTNLDLIIFSTWFLETEIFAILGILTAEKNINWFERK